jgi:glycosyltransferase involved in cell wall biosynthesis
MLARAPVEPRLFRPLVFARPTRLVWPPSWASHLPFAFWIVDALRPRTFVELGTHTGVSYSGFAQAVQELGAGTACYAVDTWAGDDQAGLYGEDIYEEWSAFHARHFGGFSRLVRSTFDEARAHFADRAIDLLHIDGLHTYEAVRHDFETWLPKVSRRSVVLFHDINVREGGFGAWRHWEEVREAYPSFAFVHGHGLGVLAVGPEMAPDVAWLTSLSPTGPEAAEVHRVFSTVGELWTAHIFLDRARGDLARVSSEHGRLQAEHDHLRATADRMAAQLREAADISAAAVRVENAWRDRLRSAEALLAERTAVASAAEARLANAEAAAVEARANAEQALQQLHALQQQPPRADDAQARRMRRAGVEVSLDERDRAASVLLATLGQAFPAAPPAPTSIAGTIRRRLRWSGLNGARLRRHPLEAARALAGLAHPAFRRNIGLLGASGVFDEGHYAGHEAVKAVPAVRLREHFIRHGDRAGLSPHPLFDAMWYRSQSPDLPPDTRLLLHYLRFGAGEGRDPHPLFDSEIYLSRIHGKLGPGESPLAHFLRVGAADGVSPHPLFDVAHYLEQHPAVAAAGHNPLLHYLETAHDERLDPHPLFSTRYYLANNPDIGTTNPLVHFVRHGAAEGRAPHPLFDVRHYLRQRPDVRHSGVNALCHYLHAAHAEDVDPHPLFDSSFYLEQAEGLGARGMNPLVHFVESGWRLGLKPNPWFDPLWYREQNPELPAALNPLVHYGTYGWREGRDPAPDFSLAGYLEQHPDVAAARVDPLAHHLQSRLREAPPVLAATSARRAPSRMFQVTGAADHGPKTVVVVSHVSPWPVRAGNEYRLRRLLQHTQRQGYRIVLVLAPIPSEPIASEAFDRAAAEFGNVVLCEPAGGIRFSLRDCPDVLSRLAGRPISAAPLEDAGTAFAEADRAFCHDTVCAVVTALAETLGRVAVVAEYVFMTRVFQPLGHGVLKVVDTHDVFSQKGSNVIAFGIEDADMPARDEARRLARADVVVAIHPADAAALSALVPEREVIVAGVDADVDAGRPWPEQHVAVLAGSANALNLAGVRDFLRFAWPDIQARVPGVMLRIVGGVGRAVPPGIRGVTTLGHVPDLAAEYAAARVAINPTVAGTGLKIKTVEALAHLTPVVGWPHSRDGLSDSLAAFVREARDWRAFAEAVAGALQEVRCPFDEAATRVIREELSAAQVYRAFDDRLQRFFAGAPSGPEGSA